MKLSAKERAALAARVVAFRNGTITEAQYIRESMPRWRGYAENLYGMWRRNLPTWVEVDDVLQVMLMAAIPAAQKWEPGRGMTADGFVLFYIAKRAQRAMAKWRGASTHGDETKNPSRFEIAFSSYVKPSDDRLPWEILDVYAEQPCAEDETIRRQALSVALGECRGIKEALSCRALMAGDGTIEGAGNLIWEDWTARVRCEVLTPEEARGVVKRSVERLTKRFSSKAGAGAGVAGDDVRAA